MGQIVKRKKKGRPSKADLAMRAASLASAAAAAEETERRRSGRRRNVRYNNFIDYDDYLDEFDDFLEEEEVGVEEEEEEDARRKEKKLKLVLNLHVEKQGRGRRRKKRMRMARVIHAREVERNDGVSENEQEDEEEEPGTKKRRVNASEDEVNESENEKDGKEEDEEEEEEDDDEEEEDEEEEEEEEEREYRRKEDEEEEEDDREGRGRKCDDGRGDDSVPGTPSDHPKEFPLPDKKSLEIILDKLQKKDIYGVYAEPVDLEELPDYLDVIDTPMDFATVRKKLANGSYSTMEQFESDVFLICSNAMKYNSPDTIYHKQARTIQELAKKKFLKIRIKIERAEHAEKDIKSEPKAKPNFFLKKQMKKPLSRTVQEPVGSDFSSGATLATPGDFHNGSVATQVGACEKTVNTDVHLENSSVADYNIEKPEELSSGKGLLSRFGRKSTLLEERRATYNISNQPVARSETVFTTFDNEIKQLVAVGLHGDHSYARSLARFAASLGPVAWKVASQRIERVLPPGYKYGRGWVGEYEPLPTPVLMLEACKLKESIFPTKVHSTSDAQNGDVTPRASLHSKEHPSGGHISEGKPSLLQSSSKLTSDRMAFVNSSAGSRPTTDVSPTQQQNLPQKNLSVSQMTKNSKLVELNLPPSSTQHDTDVIGEKQLPSISEMSTSRSKGMLRTSDLLHSVPLRQPEQLLNNSEKSALKSTGMSTTRSDLHSATPKQRDARVSSAGLPNGKLPNSPLHGRKVGSPSDSIHNQMVRAATYFPQGQIQGLTDPLEAIRLSANKVQNEQKALSLPSTETPPTFPSVINDSSNAAAAAARAWMSVGAGGFRPPLENSMGPKNQISVDSLYNPIRQVHPQIPRVEGQLAFPAGVQFPFEKNNFPFQAFIPQPVHAVDGQFQNRPMIFPQLVATDLSRFQVQSSWRGPSPQTPHSKQKPDTLPPDLNIGIQSPRSPMKQSSGMTADSQQPDLALQL